MLTDGSSGGSLVQQGHERPDHAVVLVIHHVCDPKEVPLIEQVADALPVIRVKGTGHLIQPKPKTKKGWRRLHLPPWLVVVLEARDVVENEWDVVFPSQLGKLRDRSNTNADIREALDPLGFGWVTTHAFRKTAATLLDDGGLTVREIADQLGHPRVSMTQDAYFGRHQGSPKVADALDVIGGNP